MHEIYIAVNYMHESLVKWQVNLYLLVDYHG